MDSEIKHFLGKIIVVDTDSRWLYVGKLAHIGKSFITLENVDARDLTETNSTRDMHLSNIKHNTLIINRERIIINREKLIRLSLLEDVNL